MEAKGKHKREALQDLQRSMMTESFGNTCSVHIGDADDSDKVELFVSKSIDWQGFWNPHKLIVLNFIQLCMGVLCICLSYMFVNWMKPWGKNMVNKKNFAGFCLYNALLPLGILLSLNSVTRIARRRLLLERGADLNLRASIFGILGCVSIASYVYTYGVRGLNRESISFTH